MCSNQFLNCDEVYVLFELGMGSDSALPQTQGSSNITGQPLPEFIASRLGKDALELIINHWHPSHQIVIFIGKLIKNTFTPIIYAKGCVVWTLVT